jgi:UDPglucose--hexose-1-phosphate uridylyltransferase
MGDLRKDYFLDRFVVVPSAEAKTEVANGETCPFCPGNESLTQPAILALVVKDGMLKRLSDSDDAIVDDWSVRVFPSSSPVVELKSATSYSDKPLYSEPAYGYHQVVVATPDHELSLAQISVEQMSNVLVVLQDRVRNLYNQKGVTYVSVYVNSGKAAGAVYPHSHLDIVTFSTIPPIIEAEAEGSYRYSNENGTCPACNMITVESSGRRHFPTSFGSTPKSTSPHLVKSHKKTLTTWR